MGRVMPKSACLCATSPVSIEHDHDEFERVPTPPQALNGGLLFSRKGCPKGWPFFIRLDVNCSMKMTEKEVKQAAIFFGIITVVIAVIVMYFCLVHLDYDAIGTLEVLAFLCVIPLGLSVSFYWDLLKIRRGEEVHYESNRKPTCPYCHAKLRRHFQRVCHECTRDI